MSLYCKGTGSVWFMLETPTAANCANSWVWGPKAEAVDASLWTAQHLAPVAEFTNSRDSKGKGKKIHVRGVDISGCHFLV